ncbi:MAG TPA: ribosome small subunit-dependent GTPase A [Acidimicrobiales bacterium]|nr:ribosome small subunit-dependent GTPase A [Acidimicrobiales bacterium]
MSESPPASLEAIGLTDARRVEATAFGTDAVARVTRIDRGVASVCTEAGAARMAIPFEADLAVGDFVTINDEGAMSHLLERQGAVTRLTGHRRDIVQVVAANVDLIFVVRPLDLSLSPARIQSLLTLGFDAGATPVVVLTKADLVDDATEQVAAIELIAPSVEVLVVSAITGQGVARLKELVRDRTVVFLGESGGGKSTLVNLLVGSEVLAVAETRSDGQGRHTTSHRELVALPGGGAIIDTPGVREVVAATTHALVEEGFADITALAATCRFSDCSHGAEPGCAVVRALAAGEVEQSRLDAYEAALRDAAWNERRADKAALAAQRKSYRALTRQRRNDAW